MTTEADSDVYETLPGLEQTDFPENARRMMRAAIHLFSQKGFAGTSVREIVNAADVTNPMLYYYFDDKEGLFETLLTYLIEHMNQDVLSALQQVDSLAEAVDQIILAHFEACKRSPVALRFVYSVLFGPEASTPELDIDMFDARQQIVDAAASRLKQAAEAGDFHPNEQFQPAFLTEQLFAILNGHLMRMMKEIEAYPSQEVRRRKMQQRLTPEVAAQLSAFFFQGAGRLEH